MAAGCRTRTAPRASIAKRRGRPARNGASQFWGPVLSWQAVCHVQPTALPSRDHRGGGAIIVVGAVAMMGPVTPAKASTRFGQAVEVSLPPDPDPAIPSLLSG